MNKEFTFEEAVEWCENNRNKIMKNDNFIIFYDTSDNEEEMIYDEEYGEYYYPHIGMTCLDSNFNEYDISLLENENFKIAFEFKKDEYNILTLDRYKWVSHRGYKTKEDGFIYTLTTNTPYIGTLYVDDKYVGNAWLTEENKIELNEYSEGKLSKMNLIGKSITIKNISDRITGYKCRWGEIIGEPDFIVDVGEMQGSSSCAVCIMGHGGCVKPYNK